VYWVPINVIYQPSSERLGNHVTPGVGPGEVCLPCCENRHFAIASLSESYISHVVNSLQWYMFFCRFLLYLLPEL